MMGCRTVVSDSDDDDDDDDDDYDDRSLPLRKDSKLRTIS
jgi:hypothetical protein